MSEKITLTWTTDDVINRAKVRGVEMTLEEAREILLDMKVSHESKNVNNFVNTEQVARRFDGIWDAIDVHVNEKLED